jgi:hypothetical protein
MRWLWYPHVRHEARNQVRHLDGRAVNPPSLLRVTVDSHVLGKAVRPIARAERCRDEGVVPAEAGPISEEQFDWIWQIAPPCPASLSASPVPVFGFRTTFVLHIAPSNVLEADKVHSGPKTRRSAPTLVERSQSKPRTNDSGRSCLALRRERPPPKRCT